MILYNHLRLSFTFENNKNEWTVYDFQSSNGLWISVMDHRDYSKSKESEEMELENGSIIKISDYELKVCNYEKIKLVLY